ncbi:MAG: hypothetical protein Q9187_002766 [Circinaria calcarea]
MQKPEGGNQAAAPPMDLEKGLASPALSSDTTCASNAPLVKRSDVIRRMWAWPKSLGQMLSKSKSKNAKAKKRKCIINVRKLENHALGYPKLAAYFDSDDQFSVYRRFGYLHSRLLLYKQDELRELEDDLQNLDDLDFNGDRATQRCLKSREEDDGREERPHVEARKSLFSRIEKKALEYGALLQQAHQLIAMNKPPNRDYNSVCNFMTAKRPLLAKDAAFIKEKEDLITLRPGRETSFVDAFVERMLQTCPYKPIQNVFASESQDHRRQNTLFHQISYQPLRYTYHYQHHPYLARGANLALVPRNSHAQPRQVKQRLYGSSFGFDLGVLCCPIALH